MQNETLNLRYRHDVKLCQVLLKHWGKKASHKLGLWTSVTVDMYMCVGVCNEDND